MVLKGGPRARRARQKEGRRSAPASLRQPRSNADTRYARPLGVTSPPACPFRLKTVFYCLKWRATPRSRPRRSLRGWLFGFVRRAVEFLALRSISVRGRDRLGLCYYLVSAS